MQREAKANVTPVRQRTQFSCMSCSMMMCLKANGVDTNEDEVNRVMGAKPMQGAAWEEALAAAQHYGMRATLTVPATVQQLKKWTDRGVPVMIAWNPEGRDWSHASVVFDVDEDLNVYVADPNIPDPDETVRIVPKAEFYGKWYEKWPNYLVRRPAMAVEREVSPEGRQMVASKVPADAEPVKGTKFFVSKKPSKSPYRGQPEQFKIFNEHGGVVGGYPDRGEAIAKAKKMKTAKTLMQVKVKNKAPRDPGAARHGKPGGAAGAHHNRDRDVSKGRSRKPKHKKPMVEREASLLEKLARIDEKDMNRAAQLLQYMTEKEAMKHLVKQGMHRQNAFLALKAGKILNKDRKGRLAASKEAGYKGNPDGKDIYPNEIEHGYGEPIAGGTDVMRQLQNKLIHEQGDAVPQRPESPRMASQLSLSSGKPDPKMTAALKQRAERKLLRSRSKGDFEGALMSAGFHARKHSTTAFVYAGNSYGAGVWRVSFKAGEYLNPINNTGVRVLSVTPDLDVTVFQIKQRPRMAARVAHLYLKRSQ